MKRLIYIFAFVCTWGNISTADEMNYVIKVTPTLAYIDGGYVQGIKVGDAFMVLREKGDRFVKVAQVNVIRVFETFSITEIAAVVEGEGIAVLQRAISLINWEQMGHMAESGAKSEKSRKAGNRFIYTLGGTEWSKATKLRWQNGRLTRVGGSNEIGLGLRIGRVFAENLRLSLTYRIAGDVLGVGAGDVTQLAIEIDGQFLPRSDHLVGPYFGIGVGMHQLNWHARGNNDDSTNKIGLNLLAGLQFPFSEDRWRFFVEGGYQRVATLDDLIDVSHVRNYLGFGRNF